jgi:hypothetical protein
MPAKRYPVVLTDRLSDEVYDALVDMAEDRENATLSRIDARFDVMSERFERRLAEEFGRLRVAMSGEMSGLRGEMGGLRAEMAYKHAELLKWAFLFWIGQAATVVGIVTLFG